MQSPQTTSSVISDSATAPISLALYQPDIPHNTGALLRLAACWQMKLHVVEPMGFLLNDRHLRRSAMDYRDLAPLLRHPDLAALQSAIAPGRLIAAENDQGSSIYDFSFMPGDVILLGSESHGLPNPVIEACAARIHIPMRRGVRSLNLALAAGMIASEAARQCGFFCATQ